jgi:hypothetical protein
MQTPGCNRANAENKAENAPIVGHGFHAGKTPAPALDAALLKTLQGLADGMDTDTAVLIAAAAHIRAGISALRKTSLNTVQQQTREEWLQAYDRAPLVPHWRAS